MTYSDEIALLDNEDVMQSRAAVRSATPRPAHAPQCRFCASRELRTFVDLGLSPLCQTHISPDQLNVMEPFYPLHAYVCTQCFLVQLDEYASPIDLFTEYAYFSSYSDTWIEHARGYVDAVSERFGIDSDSFVVEIASNDGYLLRHFVDRGVPVLGIEPAANVAEVAVRRGIPTEVVFFGSDAATQLAAEHGRPDLIIGNNVLAHVPRLNDFVRGLGILLGRRGLVTMEFPHLLRLIENNQYDTIYHEHFSYFSFSTVERIFAAQRLTIFDVEELPTHGGSLRIYAKHEDDDTKRVEDSVPRLRDLEAERGMQRLATYEAFAGQVNEVKRDLLEILIREKRAGKSIVGYGAPGKGNTLLNHCGIRCDFLDYTVDRSPYKQGKYTPGTRIPISPPSRIEQTRPDYLLILPWNLKEEVVTTTAFIRAWGGKWIVPIPRVTIIE